jgi:hypothetical protein
MVDDVPLRALVCHPRCHPQKSRDRFARRNINGKPPIARKSALARQIDKTVDRLEKMRHAKTLFFRCWLFLVKASRNHLVRSKETMNDNQNYFVRDGYVLVYRVVSVVRSIILFLHSCVQSYHLPRVGPLGRSIVADLWFTSESSGSKASSRSATSGKRGCGSYCLQRYVVSDYVSNLYFSFISDFFISLHQRVADEPKVLSEATETADTTPPTTLETAAPTKTSITPTKFTSALLPSQQSEAAISQNAFVSGSNMNGGCVMTGRPSSRVLAPPGGHTSIRLG